MMDSLPPPGTHAFLPSLLSHVHSAVPGFPLEPVIIQVLLLCIVAGNKNLILRTRDEDVALVSKLTTLVLNTIFGYNAHRLKCHSNSANQIPSEFLRSLFFAGSAVAPPADCSWNGSHRPRRRRVSNSRNSVGKSPMIHPISISTARSRRTSMSRSTPHPIELKPSIATLGRPQSESEDADLKLSVNADVHPQRPGFHPAGAQTDTSVPTLASSVRTHVRNVSHASTEALRLPSVVVVSGLELASLPSQKAVLQTLVDRKIIVSEGGIGGCDRDGLTLELPDGFFMVYVCRSDPWERPPIHKSLLDRFAMSSSVDVGAQTRLAMRQFRPPSSPSIALSSSHTSVTSAAFPTPNSLPRPPTPIQPLTSPVIHSAMLQQLKHLCATQARIRAPLNIYLADLFSATRHYGPLDSMMLTVRARRDAEALVRASRVLGTDRTGAELIRELAEQSRETNSTSSYPRSHSSTAHTSSDELIDELDALGVYGRLDDSSLTSHPEEPKLDVSEADIARMFPRIVSHRIRVRDSPIDEILSSAVCGAISTPCNESHEEEAPVQWERETVKDILVHILAEV